ncbi:MAG: glycosyltransferase family 4 protein [Magnetococcales bacterium]|nr:glycosyltransferase family 4 protein [Magnetococcales bacterium]
MFFTYGMSLTQWEKGGLFEREVALYRQLRPHLGGITFVTHGDRRDLAFAERLPGIDIVCNRWNLPPAWYRRHLTWMPARWKAGNVVFKSNQVKGADWGLSVARHAGRPFIARCGYLLSDYINWRNGATSNEACQASAQEKAIFGDADRVVVTTVAQQRIAVEEHGLAVDKIRVIPNYVDTEQFSPASSPAPPNRLISVGRLEPQKNLLALVEALAGLNVELWLVGEGSLREPIRQLADSLRVPVRLFGVVPHARLPELFRQCTLMLLPSLWEGHPKTLLEAMACGMPVIAGRIPALHGVVTHRENGFLCGLTPEEIRAAVLEVLGDAGLRAHMGGTARREALEHLSLPVIVERELALLRELSDR